MRHLLKISMVSFISILASCTQDKGDIEVLGVIIPEAGIEEENSISQESHENKERNVLTDAEEYFNVPEFQGTISNIGIEGNDLKFIVTASGCDGNSWIVKLITTGAIEKSLPPQRTLQLSFVNNEICTSVVGREFSFNIECLQVPTYSSVILNFWGKYGILYEY